jgi:trehalose-phosphatase
VAVVSGRDREFLGARLEGMLMLGSYGLELPPELSASGLPDGFPAEAVRTRLAAARADLERAIARFPGSRLEVKAWGLALHYRGAGPRFDEVAATSLVEAVGGAHNLKVQPGRFVVELKSREAVDKGWAMGLLVEKLVPSAVVFVGDDLGDKGAWEAVRAMPIPALATGIASPELPAGALAACNLVLGGRGELAPLMEALIDAAEV